MELAHRMKIDNQFLIGALLGALGVSTWNLVYPKIVTKRLIPIFWKPGQDVYEVPEGAANAEKFGTRLEVAGQPALYLLDTGWPINRVTMSEQTAARLQIKQFPKSNIRTQSGKILPVFGPVEVAVPGMLQTTVYSLIEIGDTNLCNPSLFLKNVDITFAPTTAGNTVTFSEKNTFCYPGSIFMPFSKRDKSGRVFFTSKIGDKLVPNTVIDTGASVSTTLNQEVSDKLGIERFPISGKTRSHFVPVSFPDTSVSFISTMNTNAGHYDSKTTEWDVLISGAEILKASFAFTMRDKGWDFAYVGLPHVRHTTPLAISRLEPPSRAIDLTNDVLRTRPTFA